MPELDESMPEKRSPGSLVPSDLIEAYVDEELSEIEARRLERRAETDLELAAEIALARRIQASLGRARLSCPPEVMARLSAEVERPSFFVRSRTWLAGLRSAWQGPAAWRPAVLGAALALAALLIVFPGAQILSPGSTSDLQVSKEDPQSGIGTVLSESPAPAADRESNAPSGADVEAARREVELAFAYLGKLGRTAESSVRQLAIERLRQDDDAI